MKFRLNSHGHLLITKNGTEVEATCPFHNHVTVIARCGNWCPHFGEIHGGVMVTNSMKYYNEVSLELCNGKKLVMLDEDVDSKNFEYATSEYWKDEEK